MDYRHALRAKGRKPFTDTIRQSLRTTRAAGDVEVTRNGLLRYEDDGKAVAA